VCKIDPFDGISHFGKTHYSLERVLPLYMFKDKVDISLYLHEGLGKFYNPDENWFFSLVSFVMFIARLATSSFHIYSEGLSNILERNESRKACKYIAYLRGPSFILGKHIDPLE